MPPSTKSSMPVMKLASSEARKETALAISSGVPMRPMGTPLMSPALSWAVSPTVCPRRSMAGVSMGPGLTTLTRILRSLRSTVQLRAKERRAALVAL